ncbi:hypothetical protein SMD44_00923 [Streptomyces alboflavus]|uniref:Head-tail adaptor protein n=1 Tax=Streptomyces alboflavus TaxID=67267 RepID=A0A1Z1W529_9ACTN|nr:hypothetical protein [Streptomyces alboflavus]ARX81525.1 hypothetical protein SMD44_00923 [Streptomyces alboflavus]
MYVATTTVSVLGDTTEDEFGDETDGTTVLAADIPAALVEATRTAMEPVTGTPRIVRTHVCRLPPGTAVDESHRIKDEVTGEIYIVVAVTRNANPFLAQPLRADLKRTGRAA